MRRARMRMRIAGAWAVVAAVCCAALGSAPAPTDNPVAADPALPEYKSAAKVTGTVRAVGSSTVCNLIYRWGEGFKVFHPEVKLEVRAGGSATAEPALEAGQCEIAPMSRPMSVAEVEGFQKKFGYLPMQVTVGLDAMAVYVNKDNPVKGLTLAQVDAIFSASLKRGGSPVDTWAQVGVETEWAARPMTRYGLRPGAGGQALFKEMALKGGDYRPDVRAEPGSSAIVNGVGADPASIGYASVFFRTKRTRPAPIAATEGGAYVEPTYEACASGEYPLARRLFIYVNKKPGAPLDPLTTEFLSFVLSKQGQEIALKDGNFPLTAAIAREQAQQISRKE